MNQALVKKWFIYHKDGYLTWRKSPCAWIRAGDSVGNRGSHGYIELGFQGERYLEHRVIFLYHHGFLPDLIDHRDTNHENNRIDNLREASKSVNAHNSDTIFGRVPYRGVSFDPKKKTKPFYSYITYRGKRKWLGYHATAEEASAVYQNEQLKIRKEVV